MAPRDNSSARFVEPCTTAIPAVTRTGLAWNETSTGARLMARHRGCIQIGGGTILPLAPLTAVTDSLTSQKQPDVLQDRSRIDYQLEYAWLPVVHIPLTAVKEGLSYQ